MAGQAVIIDGGMVFNRCPCPAAVSGRRSRDPEAIPLRIVASPAPAASKGIAMRPRDRTQGSRACVAWNAGCHRQGRLLVGALHPRLHDEFMLAEQVNACVDFRWCLLMEMEPKFARDYH